MKKILIIILCFFGISPLYGPDFLVKVSAQNLSEIVQGKRLSFDYHILATRGNKSYSGEGVVSYQDGAYSLVSESFKVYNDTKTLWILDYGAREATVEQGSSDNFLANPELILSICGFNAKPVSVVPSFGGDGLPSGMEIKMKNGDNVTLHFNNVRICEAGSLSDFGFNKKSLDSMWVVTDLR